MEKDKKKILRGKKKRKRKKKATIDMDLLMEFRCGRKKKKQNIKPQMNI